MIEKEDATASPPPDETVPPDGCGACWSLPRLTDPLGERVGGLLPLDLCGLMVSTGEGDGFDVPERGKGPRVPGPPPLSLSSWRPPRAPPPPPNPMALMVSR